MPPNNIKSSTRDGFAKAILEYANKDLYVVSADLSESLKLTEFANLHPDRFVECGIAEQNAVAVSAGIAMTNKTVVFGSFAEFLPMRCLDQIRISICMQNLKVVLASSHVGLSYGGDGESIQVFEDIGIMTSLPNMKVYNPTTANEAYVMTRQALSNFGPTYIRLYRESENELFNNSSQNMSFDGYVGKINITDKLIISTGEMLHEALTARDKLWNSFGINYNLYNLSELKPLSRLLKNEVSKYKKVVIVEDHQVSSGISSLIMNNLDFSKNLPKFLKLGINDQFGQSGSRAELLKYFRLDKDSLVDDIMNFI